MIRQFWQPSWSPFSSGPQPAVSQRANVTSVSCTERKRSAHRTHAEAIVARRLPTVVRSRHVVLFSFVAAVLLAACAQAKWRALPRKRQSRTARLLSMLKSGRNRQYVRASHVACQCAMSASPL